MVWRIARKELTDLSRDGRVRVLAGLVLLVSLVSLAAGWKSYRDISAQHRTAQAATRSQWLEQPEKNPHSAAHYGVYAFKPQSPLAIVDTGIDPYVGVAVWLEAHKQNEMKYRPAQDRTAVQRFGDLGGAEVLQVLLPLFIVLMSFAAFSGEREQGTLRQLLSVGARPRDLALGKALGLAAGLGMVLLPATLLAAAALALSTREGLLADDPQRVAALAGSYVAYYGILIAVALVVSAWARSSRLALVVLLTFWFANSLVAPGWLPTSPRGCTRHHPRWRSRPRSRPTSTIRWRWSGVSTSGAASSSRSTACPVSTPCRSRSAASRCRKAKSTATRSSTTTSAGCSSSSSSRTVCCSWEARSPHSWPSGPCRWDWQARTSPSIATSSTRPSPTGAASSGR
ncbi:MAG: ABC transporter permease subunit [Vicinamibacterales bacterium]